MDNLGQSPKTTTRQQNVVRVNPIPEVFASTLATNTTVTLEYQNKLNEKSEIRDIVFICPPLMKFTIYVTVNHQKVEVHKQMYVKDLPIVDGKRVLNLRADGNKPLKFNKSEYLYIDLTHAYVGTTSYKIIVNKNQILEVGTIYAGTGGE